MGPTTRSKVQDSIFVFGGDLEHITSTLDPIQKTFVCARQYMPHWRYALHHRYMGTFVPKGLHCTWQSYSASHKTFEDCAADFANITPIPSHLYQSTIEMRTHKTKILKIHFYFTTCKILIQGKACRQWVEEEFEKLRAIVHTLASCASSDPLSITQMRQPDTTTAAAILTSGTPCAVEENNTRGVVVPPLSSLAVRSQVEPGDLACPLTPSSRQQPVSALLSPSGSSLIDHSLPPASQSLPSSLPLCSPSPTVPAGNVPQVFQSSTEEPSSCPPHAMTTVPSESLPSPQQDTTSVDGKNVSKSSDIHNNNDNNNSSVTGDDHDTITVTKDDNDKSSVTGDYNDNTTGDDNDNTPETGDDHDTITVTKDNNDKSSVTGDYNDNTTGDDNDNSSVTTGSQQQSSVIGNPNDNVNDNDNTSGTEDHSKPVLCGHEECVSRAEFQQTKQTLEAEISALRSALHQTRQFIKIELDAMTTQLVHLQSQNSKIPQPGKTPQPHSSKHTLHSKATSHKSSFPKKAPLLSNAPANKVRPNGDSDNNKANSTAVPESHSQQTSTPNPLQRYSVTRDTTTILLGDNVLQGVNLSRSSPPNSTPLKVCVNDLTVSQLTEWLSGQTPTPAVRQATVHVGIHDCTQVTALADSAISSEKWKGLLSQCRRVFPKASLKASAILPARGRHPSNAVIHPSNRNLQQACDGMGVQYKNHTSVFTTSSGAPRMALYKDAILPTRKGTARLAENLFAGNPADGEARKTPGSEYRYRPTGRPSSSPSSQPSTGPSAFRSSTGQVLKTQSNNHTPQFSQPAGPSSFPHAPTDQRYSEAFPPLPNTNPTPPLPHAPTDQRYLEAFPPLHNTNHTPPPPPPAQGAMTTQRTDTPRAQHSWSPSPPRMMPPRVFPPMFYPFPHGFPPPSMWQWPPFMPVPPSYGQVA